MVFVQERARERCGEDLQLCRSIPGTLEFCMFYVRKQYIQTLCETLVWYLDDELMYRFHFTEADDRNVLDSEIVEECYVLERLHHFGTMFCYYRHTTLGEWQMYPKAFIHLLTDDPEELVGVLAKFKRWLKMRCDTEETASRDPACKAWYYA